MSCILSCHILKYLLSNSLPFSLSNGLHFVSLCLSWQFNCGHQFLLFPANLLFFNFNLLPAFDNLYKDRQIS